MSSRIALPVTPSNAASLKTLQFWNTSTKAEPLCSWARRNVSSMWAAVHVVGSGDEARLGTEGQRQRVERWSRLPNGVDFVTFPSSLVGEYWPLVSP